MRSVKKSLSAVVTQNIKWVFILFLRTIDRDFRSSHFEPSTLKIAYLRMVFLHYTSRYVSVWVKQRNNKAISKYCVI